LNFHGVWQSLHSATVIRYLPRATREFSFFGFSARADAHSIEATNTVPAANRFALMTSLLTSGIRHAATQENFQYRRICLQ
jgi:hypothetical protein